MKFKEIKTMDNAQLNEKLVEARKELIKINGQIARDTPPKNIGQIRQLKKSIAKLLTSKNQKKR